MCLTGLPLSLPILLSLSHRPGGAAVKERQHDGNPSHMCNIQRVPAAAGGLAVLTTFWSRKAQLFLPPRALTQRGSQNSKQSSC